jgi:uncharacterized protein
VIDAVELPSVHSVTSASLGPLGARIRWVAVVIATLLVAAGCSDGPDSAAAEPAGYRAFGSIERANVVDAPPDAELALLDPTGAQVAEGRADRFGSLIFRSVDPGDDYVVVRRDGDRRERSEPFTVLAESDTPPSSLYEDQILEPGLNYMVMRDGIELAATVRLPDGASIDDGPFPTLIEYSGYAVAPPNDLLESIGARLADPDTPADPLAPATSTVVGSLLGPLLGFAVVSVQIRGSGCSGGDFDLFDLPSIYDGYDAIETVAAQPWAKGGKVGMVGISYSGYSQLFVGGTRPPSLAALAPMSVLGDLYDGIGYPGGIFNNGFALGWLTERQEDSEPAPEGGQSWAAALIEAGDDRCAENQRMRLQTQNGPEILEGTEFREPALFDRRTPADWAEQIDVPVFLVGGLQDEQLGSHWVNVIDRFDDNDRFWVTIFNGNHNDALAPEVFTRWVEFLDLFVADEVPEIPEAVLGLSGLLYQELGGAAAPQLEQTRFAGTSDLDAARRTFEADPRVRLLMDVGGGPLGPRSLQSTSELAFDDWPPPGTVATRWHLAEGGRLVTEGEETGSGSDEYRSDPSARPETNAEDGSVVYSADRPYEWEPVVDRSGLGYVSDPLEQGLLIAGPASLDVRIASSDDDADLQVTLTEVRPDGQETYLSSGWLRASHRALDEDRSSELLPFHSHRSEDAEKMVPGEAVDVRVPIHPTAAWLRAGSRIRVTILAPGGDVPLWKFRTLEKGDDTVSVVRDPAAPSSLVLPVVSRTEAPTPRPACQTLRGQPCRPYLAAANGG